MFGLIKTLIVLAVLLGAVIAGLAYLPDETTKRLGVQAAGVFSKGCRGGKLLISSVKDKLKDEAVDAAKEEAAGALDPSADPAPAE